MPFHFQRYQRASEQYWLFLRWNLYQICDKSGLEKSKPEKNDFLVPTIGKLGINDVFRRVVKTASVRMRGSAPAPKHLFIEEKSDTN